MNTDLLINMDIPTQELSRHRVSLPQMYANKKEIDQTLALLKQAYPAVKSAYQPSGKSTLTAYIMMFLSMPVVAAITAGVSILLLLILEWLTQGGSNGSYNRLLGFVMLMVNVFLVLILMFVPPWLYTAIGRLFKNRSTGLPMLVTALTSIPLAILFFWPMWSGLSLAPTEITFLTIPIKWIVVISGILLSAASIAIASEIVSQQKFCEETGIYLKRMRQVYFDFQSLDPALNLLPQRASQNLSHLPSLSLKERKSTYLDLTLWGHAAAQTAYLELTLVFNETPTKSTQDRKNESWLVFSEKLNRSEMEACCQVMAEK